jgi:hypothetical protein
MRQSKLSRRKPEPDTEGSLCIADEQHLHFEIKVPNPATRRAMVGFEQGKGKSLRLPTRCSKILRPSNGIFREGEQRAGAGGRAGPLLKWRLAR